MNQEVSDLSGLQPEDLEAIEVLRLSSVNSHLCFCHLTDITKTYFHLSHLWVLIVFDQDSAACIKISINGDLKVDSSWNDVCTQVLI